MGGDIKLVSEKGKGSSFTVTLELPKSIQVTKKYSDKIKLRRYKCFGG
tara:strand:- start:127 stop:270 length:144 start_codon:yes stop_codon:yes gene_type:complete